MVARSVEAVSAAATRRCSCGHYPTTHVRVVPAVGSPGSFALVPTGPCRVCGEAACRRYAPGGVPVDVPERG